MLFFGKVDGLKKHKKRKGGDKVKEAFAERTGRLRRKPAAGFIQIKPKPG